MELALWTGIASNLSNDGAPVGASFVLRERVDESAPEDFNVGGVCDLRWHAWMRHATS
jgi:hypothetical protein